MLGPENTMINRMKGDLKNVFSGRESQAEDKLWYCCMRAEEGNKKGFFREKKMSALS